MHIDKTNYVKYLQFVSDVIEANLLNFNWIIVTYMQKDLNTNITLQKLKILILDIFFVPGTISLNGRQPQYSLNNLKQKYATQNN